MQVHRYVETAAFLAHATSFLTRAAAENSLMLSLAEWPSKTLPEECYLAVVERAGAVVGCAVRTPPYGLLITSMDAAALACLVADVRQKYPRLSTVFGPEAAARAFARHWTTGSTFTPRVRMHQRLFEAHAVHLPAGSPGGDLRPADERDADVVVQWAVAFRAEAGLSPEIDYAKVAVDHLARRAVFVWDDHGPVCMAWVRGTPPRPVSISCVYTPREQRQRGYASAAVATIARRMLDAGASVCRVSTDVTNTTTNKIYPSVGFQPVCDMCDIELDRGDATEFTPA